MPERTPTPTPKTGARRSPAPRDARRAIGGGIAGNYVDQFDIFLPVIALAPAVAALYGGADPARYAALIFVATLFGRPLGAAFFGHLADRIGRTSTTQVTIAGVGVTTLLIALCPPPALIGGATFGVILALRFLGGFFLGGEYTSAVPLAMEWSAPARRGLASGLIMSISPWANATIAAITLGLLSILEPAAYVAWGWRLTFGLGALMAFAMFVYYRRYIVDAPMWKRSARRSSPLRDILFGDHRRHLQQVFVLMSGLWLFTNMAIPVLTGQLKQDGSRGDKGVTLVMLAGTAASALTMAICGHASTALGRRRFFIAFGAAAIVLAPLTYLTAVRGSALTPTLLAVVALQIVTVSAYGPVGEYLSERFATGVRASGYGVGYSLSIVIPALYPFYLPSLVKLFGAQQAVAGLLVVAALLLIVGAALGPATATREPLP